MKGLLRKDLLLSWKYGRAYLIISVFFFAMTLMNATGILFVVYPTFLASLMPMNLLMVEETCRWPQYADTLPVTRRQLVSEKYLLGALFALATLLITLGVLAVRLAAYGLEGLWLIFLAGFFISFVGQAASLPFMFRFGTTKGRIAFFVATGLTMGIVGALTAITDAAEGGIGAIAFPWWLLPGLCVLALGLYVLSWLFSVRAYEKREFT